MKKKFGPVFAAVTSFDPKAAKGAAQLDKKPPFPKKTKTTK